MVAEELLAVLVRLLDGIVVVVVMVMLLVIGVMMILLLLRMSVVLSSDLRRVGGVSGSGVSRSVHLHGVVDVGLLLSSGSVGSGGRGHVEKKDVRWKMKLTNNESRSWWLVWNALRGVFGGVVVLITDKKI